jgi:hypothetical protein
MRSRSLEGIDRYLPVLVYVVILWSFGQLIVELSHPGVPATHDVAAHYTYTYLFDRALLQGQFPVRWVEWVRDGHGQPLFSFYQPGLYYLTQLVHVVVPSLSRSLMLTVLLAWGAGSFFTFAWLRPFGTLPASVAAIVFAFSPYLVLDVFVRGAYPEFAAIACAPGVLWSLDRSLADDRIHVRLVLSLLLAVMALCHLPSLLIFSPIFTGYALYTILSRSRPTPPRRVIATAAAALLALGMSAFYVLPALAEIDYIWMRKMTTGYYDFHQHFVAPRQWFDYRWGYGGSVPGSDDQMSFQVGRLQWLLIGAALVAAAKDVRRAGLILFWLAAIALTLFLMTGAAAGVWEHMPGLAFVQFPWRLLMAIATASSALVALLLARLRSARLQAIAGLVIVVAAVMPMYDRLQPKGYHPPTILQIDFRGWRGTDPTQSAAALESGYHPASVRRPPVATTGRWTTTQGQGRVSARAERDDRLTLDVDTAGGVLVTINTPYFPGWILSLDGREIPASVDTESGFMQATIPAGRHTLDARLTDTPIRRWSNIVSAGSLSVFAILLMVSVRRPATVASSANANVAAGAHRLPELPD